MSAPPTRSTGGNHRNESLRLQLLPARAFFLLPLPQPDTRAAAVLVNELHPERTPIVRQDERPQAGGEPARLCPVVAGTNPLSSRSICSKPNELSLAAPCRNVRGAELAKPRQTRKAMKKSGLRDAVDAPVRP
jgi:hypothetical protein